MDVLLFCLTVTPIYAEFSIGTQQYANGYEVIIKLI
jgi:hypothetical protein